MANLNCDIPTSLLAELTNTADSANSVSQIVTTALSQYLDKPIHTLFQVSTSGALVAGLYSGVVSAGMILRHGDFGLGTFEHLDGEMVILDGHIYRVTADGKVAEAPPDSEAPFAVVTKFKPELDVQLEGGNSLEALAAQCDLHRKSQNIFYAFQLDGLFHRVQARAMSPQKNNSRLIDAAKSQAEFEFREIKGTLVGLWSPGFSSAFSVAGYHFHFISDDRQHGGHLLECSAGTLRLRMEALSDFHIALPENESFLKSDLSKNTSDELTDAEGKRKEKRL